ncbi:iron ABC transporter permease [Roseomonas sp. AR75]|uniref:ABC transporter permease n=1 Tax=Roseomonas sp. AR75 TaxID=2562311 RepID=UPI0010C07453|nr:iron ABC transporter permease [Roseomonas sp. AR75]
MSAAGIAQPNAPGWPARLLRGIRHDPWTAIAWATVAFMLVFVAWPLAELARQSFIGQESGRLGLENYQTFFGSSYFRRALFNSLTVGVLGTVIALAIGLPLALVFARFDFAGKAWIEVAILLSMLSPPFVGAYAWIMLFGRSGLVTEAARGIGIELPPIYGAFGIALASAFALYPVVFLVVRGGLARVNRTLEDAAASLGRGRIGVVRTVTLPLILPSVLTAALLVFLGIISDFGTPSILGEGERFPVLATLAFSLYLSEIGAEPGMAATTCAVLVVIAMALVVAVRIFSTRRSVADDTGGGAAPVRLRGRTGALLGFGTAALVAIASTPQIVVTICSFLEVRGVVFQPVLTLDNYARAIEALGDALWNSLIFAGLALALIILVGSAIGYVIARRTGPLTRALDLLIMVPYVVPGTVLGIGYATVFNEPPLLLTGTATIIVTVYFVRRLPYMTRASAGIVYQIDRGLEDAARSLGDPPLTGFRRVMAPLMRPGILAGAAIAWVEVFSELSASIVLYTGTTRTLPIAAYQQALSGDVGMAAAYATMLVGVAAAGLVLFVIARGSERERSLGWL